MCATCRSQRGLSAVCAPLTPAHAHGGATCRGQSRRAQRPKKGGITHLMPGEDVSMSVATLYVDGEPLLPSRAGGGVASRRGAGEAMLAGFGRSPFGQ